MDELDVAIFDFKVKGMTCPKCSERIENGLKELPGVFAVKANHAENHVIVEYEVDKIDLETISRTIEATGYDVLGYEEKDTLTE